ncbi:MAG: hypothetical protein ACE5IR_15050, partial [bacterium]
GLEMTTVGVMSGRPAGPIAEIVTKNDFIKKFFLDPALGEMLCQLAGIDGMRIWHDQTLQKPPWANCMKVNKLYLLLLQIVEIMPVKGVYPRIHLHPNSSNTILV